MNPRSATLLVVVLAISAMPADRAHAVPGDCILMSSERPSEVRPVAVNLDSFAGAPELSTDEVVVAVNHAIAQWNETAAGMAFEYVGDTSCLALAGGCCDASLVTYVEDCGVGSKRAFNVAGCGDTRNHTTICGEGTSPWLWDVNGLVAGESDLAATITHEFGHSAGIKHPEDGERATLGAAVSTDDMRRRQLYKYDVFCAEPAAEDFRELNAHRRTQLPDGSFGVESSISPIYDDLSNHDLVAYDIGPSSYTGVVWREADQFRFRRYGTSTPIRDFSSLGFGSGLALSANPESMAGPLRLYWTRAQAGQEYNRDSRRQVRVRWSSNEFQSSTVGALTECTSMSAWYTCSPASTTPVASKYRLQTAYDESSGRTVTVWTDQQRTNGGAGDYQIRVAFGEIAPDMLPPAVYVPASARTTVSPGVACSPQAADGSSGGTFDCIVAYADMDTDDWRIRVARFSGASISTHWQASFDTVTTAVDAADAETTAGISAWYSEETSKWYLAFLSTEPTQRVKVWESADSLSWSKEGDYGVSILTPRFSGGGADSTYLYSAR